MLLINFFCSKNWTWARKVAGDSQQFLSKALRELIGCEIPSGNSGQVHSKDLTVAEPASVFQLQFSPELAFWKVFLLFLNFQAEGIDFVAFDEGERILIVSFLRKSLSRVLWTSHKRIDRDAMRFQELGAILDWLGWLAGYVAQIASIWPP